jgi:HPt (histidine-containing phosphotransfer) domain-containing protein
MNTSSASWSPDTMIERIGGDDELARQLVSLFLVESPKMLSALRESIDGGTADAIRRAAHAFKGSVANFIDGGPVATALEIEMCGRQGSLDAVPGLFARLEREVAELVSGMRSFESEGA